MNSLTRCIGYNALNNVVISSGVSKKFNCVYEVILKKNFSKNTNAWRYRYGKPKFQNQAYDAFLVLDFESTCLSGFNTIQQQEIIEFPCIWVNGSDMKIVKIFHKYVKPVVHPTLDPFCTQLTGITDDMITNEKHFNDVFEEFTAWYVDLKLKTNVDNVVFVTDGNWDLEFMLPEQLKLSKLPVPGFMKNWINIRESFYECTGKYPKTLNEMLTFLNLKREGRLHCGIDDAMNIYRVLYSLAEKGYVFS